VTVTSHQFLELKTQSTVQPVPGKIRLEMVIGMETGIVNGLLIFITLITHFHAHI